MSERPGGRANDALRSLSFEPDFIIHPEGSVLSCFGNTKVLCNASVEDGAPRWMSNEGKAGGWITGEYSMLPRSTHTRSSRETRGPRGRTQEIQRLIGRSLRAGFDLSLIGERTITIDCDVLQADGGTRTAAISGGYLACRIAIEKLIRSGEISSNCLLAEIGAISVGILGGEHRLDLCYEEDVAADVDANVVMTSEGSLIEVQSTAEGEAFSREDLSALLDLAWKGISEIQERQKSVLESCL